MIRLIQRRLIIPRGDTGTFSVPVLSSYNSGDAAVFSIIDPKTQRRVYNKLMYVTDSVISVRFEHGDTVNLPVGKFLWDIKFYQDPIIDEGQVVGGKEVDSYYAAFTMPECEVRQTGDNLLTADDAPGSTLTPQQVNAINAALLALNEAVEKTETNVMHYPTIIDGVWNVWDANLEGYAATGVEATGNGIAFIEKTNTEGLVDTYTVNFTDGTTFLYNVTNGSGISSIVKDSTSGLEDTYVIIYTDGNFTTFTVTNGATPNISIGTVQEGPIAAASITGDAANPVLNLTLPNANVPTKVSELENDAGYLTSETDPTVPQWAKASTKPSYTAQEVGALPDDTFIPTKVSDLQDDSGHYIKPANGIPASDLEETYLTSFTETDPTVPEWAKQSTKPAYTAQEVGALPVDTYIPEKTSDLVNDSNYVVDANYVHTDNNYTTAEKDKLSGIAAGAEVNVNADWNAVSGDAQILNKPTRLSAFLNDEGYLTAETDPTVPAWAKAAQKPTYTAAEVGAPTVQQMNEAIANVNTMKIHICAQGEYNSETGIPTIQNPDTQTFYLVPGGENNNLFIEWAYVNSAWERFGSADVDLSNYATKNEVLFEAGSAVGSIQAKEFTINGQTFQSIASGIASTAIGTNVTASGVMSFAEGQMTVASGNSAHSEGIQSVASGGASHAEGNITHASGSSAHAEGENTTASGVGSHAEGVYTQATGKASHAEGHGTIANATAMHVSGKYNILSSLYPDWVAGTEYSIGDKVTRLSYGYECIEANSDSTWTRSKWKLSIGNSVQAIVVGNGTSGARSNAYALTWTGDGKYAGDVYVHANTDSSGGVKLATVNDIPEVPVIDVQVNGISVLSGGVANVPKATSSSLGVALAHDSAGVEVGSSGNLRVYKASSANVKDGTHSYRPIVPFNQHESTFYGLAKAAGHDEKDSTESVGTYTPEAKAAIQSMLGVSDLIATAENNLIASKAYAIGDVFTANGKLYKVTTAIAADGAIVLQNEGETVSGANAVETKVGEGFVKFTDYANYNKPGIVSTQATYGTTIYENHKIGIAPPNHGQCKEGYLPYVPVTVGGQHEAAFYGLAKAAGADEKNSTLPVGQYTDTAKTAIRSMIGATSSNVIAVQDTQPTDTDTKIWLPETAETPVTVPTVAEMESALAGKVGDVQVNGVSVVSNGIANVPLATSSRIGAVKLAIDGGLTVTNDGSMLIDYANRDIIKNASSYYKPIVPAMLSSASFYGLAKAAGDTTQAASSNAVGTYTDNAKASIKAMLGIQDGSTGTVDISGTTPTIAAVENTRYVCGEVTSLDFTPAASGICIVRFTSGSSVTVLTLPSTVKFPEWFDPTSLETNTIYEICVTDGVYGAVMSWAL